MTKFRLLRQQSLIVCSDHRTFGSRILPSYILTIGGDHAINLNTGEAPVISTLITVFTEDMLASKRSIYSTPLTTMAFQLARNGARASRSTQISVYHRAAVEAFAAKVHSLSSSLDNIGPDFIIERLAHDLQSDGMIDNADNGTPIGGIEPAIISHDPMKRVNPNTGLLV